jgi:hypothetical protein
MQRRYEEVGSKESSPDPRLPSPQTDCQAARPEQFHQDDSDNDLVEHVVDYVSDQGPFYKKTAYLVIVSKSLLGKL